jgi:hypothetical protein
VGGPSNSSSGYCTGTRRVDNAVSIEYRTLLEEQRDARQSMNNLGLRLQNQFPNNVAIQRMNCQTRRSSHFGYPSISFQNTSTSQNHGYLQREILLSEHLRYEMGPGPECNPSRDPPRLKDISAITRRFSADVGFPSSAMQPQPQRARPDGQIHPTSSAFGQHRFSSDSMHDSNPNTSRTAAPLRAEESRSLMNENSGEEIEKHKLKEENRILESENNALRLDVLKLDEEEEGRRTGWRS